MRVLMTVMLLIFWIGYVPAQTPDSLDLQACITYGIQHHGSIQKADNNKVAALASGKEALAGYLPLVTLKGGIDDNLKVQEQVIPAGIFGDEDMRVAFTKQFNTSGSLELRQALYDQSLLIGLRARRYNEKQADLEWKQAEEDLVYLISTDYYQVQVYALQIRLLHRNAEIYADQVSLLELRLDKGVLAPVELKRVQVDYHKTLTDLRIAENNLQQSLTKLKLDMGYPVTTPLEVKQVQTVLPEHFMDSDWTPEDFIPQDLVAYQLDSVQAQLLALDYKAVQAQNLPKLSAYVRYGTTGFGDDLGESFSTQQTFSSIGLQLSATLFEGFGKKARATKARIVYENAVIDQQVNTETYRKEAVNSHAQLVTSRISLEEQLQQMQLSEMVFNTTDLQYQKGVVSLKDWLDDQLSFQQTQNNYLRAVVDFYVALLGFNKSRGTLTNDANLFNEN